MFPQFRWPLHPATPLDRPQFTQKYPFSTGKNDENIIEYPLDYGLVMATLVSD